MSGAGTSAGYEPVLYVSQEDGTAVTSPDNFRIPEGLQRYVTEGQVSYQFAETERAEAVDVDLPGPAQLLLPACRLGRVERLGAKAEKAENHRPIGRMPDAGVGEAAVQGHVDPHRSTHSRYPADPRTQRVEEPVCGHHRAHRVRARRADADLEDVEYAEEHGSQSV